MKKLLALVTVLAVLLFAGSAMADWSVTMKQYGSTQGNAIPNYTLYNVQYGTINYYNYNTNGNTNFGSGINVSGPVGVTTSNSFQNSFTTSTGSFVYQSGGYKVTGSGVSVWSYSSSSSK